MIKTCVLLFFFFCDFLFSYLKPKPTMGHTTPCLLAPCMHLIAAALLISWLVRKGKERRWCHSFRAIWPWEPIYCFFRVTQSPDPFPVSWPADLAARSRHHQVGIQQQASHSWTKATSRREKHHRSIDTCYMLHVNTHSPSNLIMQSVLAFSSLW